MMPRPSGWRFTTADSGYALANTRDELFHALRKFPVVAKCRVQGSVRSVEMDVAAATEIIGVELHLICDSICPVPSGRSNKFLNRSLPFCCQLALENDG